jgi:ABC-type phosphate transport system permease subunit
MPVSLAMALVLAYSFGGKSARQSSASREYRPFVDILISIPGIIVG